MKPIFLVIVGSAMLIPAMHQIVDVQPENEPAKKVLLQRPLLETIKQKPDSEVLINDLSYWIGRLP
ncbi:MAG TPA: hypothetical protein PKM63_05205 [Panacibacter sp.]|nr:hypothetical protein [Panacibacter sp.]HNP43659.1 hypothetical protein [Panacibacter sp.]